MNQLLKERSVLLVEDNPGDARLIAELLRDADSGLTLRNATTLASALETLASEPTDAVILDLGLPDSDGLATFKRLQQAAPSVAIIVLSGNSDSRTAVHTVQEGAQDFLVKGHIDGETLVRSVGYAIERKDAQRSLLDSDERLRRNLEITESIAELSRRLVSETLSIEQITDLTLSYALTLTSSEHSCVSRIDPDSGDDVMTAESSAGPDDGRRPAERQSKHVFPVDPDGTYPHLWGVSLNTARPFFTNAPEERGDRGADTPFDRVPLTSFLSVPVVTEEGIVGQVAVANAPGGYTPADVGALERLASLHAAAVTQHRSQEALRLSEADLRASNAQLAKMIHDVAETMGSVVEARDPYTQGHQVRVARIATAIATEMGQSDDEVACIEMAGLLHDIGKMSVPSEILSKPGTLSNAESALIREHPVRGSVILEKITFPWPIADIVLQHHERCDGSGYPCGLSSEGILIQARILAVADVLEAMSTFRPYRAALGADAAIAEITGTVGKYDPEVVKAVVRLGDDAALGL